MGRPLAFCSDAVAMLSICYVTLSATYPRWSWSYEEKPRLYLYPGNVYVNSGIAINEFYANGVTGNFFLYVCFLPGAAVYDQCLPWIDLDTLFWPKTNNKIT